MHSMLSLANAAPAGRVFALDSQTLMSIGIQVLNGIILTVALGRLLYNPVKDFMRKRTERIQSQKEEAEKTMARANELIAEYKAKLDNIDKERREILEAARLEATDASRIILQEARQEADAIIQRALESASVYEERLREETRHYIIELASLMAQKYLVQAIDDETQDKLFEEALAELEDAQWQH